MATQTTIEERYAEMSDPCIHGTIMVQLPDAGWVLACDGCGERPGSHIANDGIEAVCYCCA